MDAVESRETPSPSTYDRVAAKADEIEAELKRIGYWQAAPIDPAALRFKQPFAADTMTFRQWLQFVFLPKVRDLVARRQALPDGSVVGAHALRALDGDRDADQLVSLLTEFDALFGTPRVDLAPVAGRRPPRRFVRYAAWTAVVGALGVLFYGYGHRLAPAVRTERYTYAATGPASGAYESISVAAVAEGRAGRLAAREVVLRMYTPSGPVPDGDATVTFPAGTYAYRGADGAERSGPAMSADAVSAWMAQCGVLGAPAALNAEAAEVAGLVERIGHDPAAAYQAAGQSPAGPGPTTEPSAAPAATTQPTGRPIRVIATGTAAFDRPGVLPLWVRLGLPIVVWLIGLGAIAMFGRK